MLRSTDSEWGISVEWVALEWDLWAAQSMNSISLLHRLCEQDSSNTSLKDALSLSLCFQDLRALALLLSVHTPKQLNSALIPTLQELLNKCRACQQQRNSLQEQEAKERKTKGLVLLWWTFYQIHVIDFFYPCRVGHSLAPNPSSPQKYHFIMELKFVNCTNRLQGDKCLLKCCV